jgi:hypothetical protein
MKRIIREFTLIHTNQTLKPVKDWRKFAQISGFEGAHAFVGSYHTKAHEGKPKKLRLFPGTDRQDGVPKKPKNLISFVPLRVLRG